MREKGPALTCGERSRTSKAEGFTEKEYTYVILEGVPILSGRLKNLRVGWLTNWTLPRPETLRPDLSGLQGDNMKYLF